MLTDFVAFPEGEEEGSQGLERSVTPWDVQKKTRILKGCESSKKRPNGDLASLQDALISLTVPGIYASLQSLATFSNPFGIMAAIVTTTKSVSTRQFQISNSFLRSEARRRAQYIGPI